MRLSAWLHQHLPQVWTSRGLFARLLQPIAWVHAALLTARGLVWRMGWRQAHRLPVPVIVVGNVVAGGAGKTPLTIALVNHLQQQGWKAGVVSRGHGRLFDDIRAVLPGSLPTEVGDEPLLIHQKTGAPVWVAALRAEAGRALLQAHPEVNILVCDDGLQHWALARDLEICVMDERGLGNGWLLPAGPLREPWPRSVDLLLHTGTNGLPGGFQALRELAPLAHDAHGRSRALSSLIGQPVDAVAGLARPEAFFAMLRAAGLQLQQTTALPDHFDYADGSPNPSDRLLLCTEKDAAKLWLHQPEALAVPLLLTPEAAFWQALNQRLAEQPFR
jgi:tetraacyldisaccharide 4'-kinase